MSWENIQSFPFFLKIFDKENSFRGFARVIAIVIVIDHGLMPEIHDLWKIPGKIIDG